MIPTRGRRWFEPCQVESSPKRWTTRLPALSIRLHDDEVVSGRAADAYDAAFDKDAMSALCYRASDGPAGGVATHLGWTRTPDGIVELIARWWESHAVQEPDRDSTRSRVRTAVRSAQAPVAR